MTNKKIITLSTIILTTASSLLAQTQLNTQKIPFEKFIEESTYTSNVKTTTKGIVFEGKHNKNKDIFLINKESKEAINLTNNKGKETNLSVNYDGSKIFYEEKKDKQTDIYMIDRTKNKIINLTNTKDKNEKNPYVDSEGKYVVYDVGPKETSIEILNTITKEITTIPKRKGERDYQPIISGDGTTIIYFKEKTSGSISLQLWKKGMEKSTKLLSSYDELKFIQTDYSGENIYLLKEGSKEYVLSIHLENNKAIKKTIYKTENLIEQLSIGKEGIEGIIVEQLDNNTEIRKLNLSTGQITEKENLSEDYEEDNSGTISKNNEIGILDYNKIKYIKLN